MREAHKMKVFADIGELGWALYLSAYTRWLNERGEKTTVITDRGCLFESSKIVPIPKEFFDKFGEYPADCFGRRGNSDKQIREVLNAEQSLDNVCDDLKFGDDRSFKGKTIYKPYPVKSNPFPKSILVFPRYRASVYHMGRNLSYDFYSKLIGALCVEFPHKLILSLGTEESYDITENVYKNYINLRKKTNIQELIDYCSSACVTIGGTSAPPKIALLQGTPSFIIGHEKERFMVEDNWIKTKVGFYEVSVNSYLTLDIPQCIKEVVEFVKCL